MYEELSMKQPMTNRSTPLPLYFAHTSMIRWDAICFCDGNQENSREKITDETRKIKTILKKKHCCDCAIVEPLKLTWDRTVRICVSRINDHCRSIESGAIFSHIVPFSFDSIMSKIGASFSFHARLCSLSLSSFTSKTFGCCGPTV